MKIGDIYVEKFPYNADKIEYIILCIDEDSVFCRKTKYNAVKKKGVVEPELVSHCILEKVFIENHLEEVRR